MKGNTLKPIALIIAVFLLLCAIPVTADETVSEAQGFIDGILAYNFAKENENSVQEFINGSLTKNAGISSEWYVIALSQNGNYDFTLYEEALIKYVNTNETASASTRLKYALALVAIGSEDSYINEQIEASIGEQGIMSIVYGLHLLNNGYTSSLHTVDSLIEEILLLQLPDGGWALSGEYADVDVTAMTVQALAPYYYIRDEITTAIDKAISLLSSRQKDDGEFASYGLDNPESAAQVIVALSALGIDCTADDRFIKNGTDLFDVMARYHTTEGGYCHISGAKTNANATVQVFFAAASYLRMQQGKSSLYIFEKNENAPSVDSDNGNELSYNASVENSAEITDIDNSKSNYKLYVIIALLVLSVAVAIVLFVKKKSNAKNLVLLLCVAAVLIAAVLLTDFSSVDDYYEGTLSKSNIIGDVTITIRCDKIEDSVSNNGVILSETVCSVAEGETVYDILAEVTAKNKIHLETNGNNEGLYVEGIANIYELQYGDLSGWVYLVNGESPSVSCGDYLLKDGDKIEWVYTLTLGEDIG